MSEYFVLDLDKEMKQVVSLDNRYIPAYLKPGFSIKRFTDIRWEDRQNYEQCCNIRVISKPGNSYPDYLKEPLPLISTSIKKIFEDYEQYFCSTAVFLSDPQLKIQKIYWLCLVKELECLAESTEFYSNHMLKRLVLNRNKINNRKVFIVNGIMEKRLVVHLDVAESLLRRPMEGIVLTPVFVV